MTDLQITSPQPIRRVAFEGELGAFSEEAVVALWPEAELLATASVADVVRAVSSGKADAGVLPVENSVAGGVAAAYDALAGAPDLYAVAETVLSICQCLVAPAGATLDTVRVIESHPVALAQCRKFLAGIPHVREHLASDTAGAARAVAESGDTSRAAIASRRAAIRYGLTILLEHVEDRPDNQTRFMAVARAPVRIEPGRPARTSVMFTTANKPGALLRALESIARLQLNMSKLESRPTGEPWTYRFFADIDHSARDPRLSDALELLVATTQTCRILGTYARTLP